VGRYTVLFMYLPMLAVILLRQFARAEIDQTGQQRE
jgi:hypothetical protein